MSEGGGIPTAVLDTLEYPAALERVAAHTAGSLGAARLRSRAPLFDLAAIRDALAQVTELAAQLLTDDAIRGSRCPMSRRCSRCSGFPAARSKRRPWPSSV